MSNLLLIFLLGYTFKLNDVFIFFYASEIPVRLINLELKMKLSNILTKQVFEIFMAIIFMAIILKSSRWIYRLTFEAVNRWIVINLSLQFCLS